jgi:hypothetical protein
MGAKEPAVVGILASTPALGARDRKTPLTPCAAQLYRLDQSRLYFTESATVASGWQAGADQRRLKARLPENVAP